MDDGPSEGTIIFADRPDARVEIMWWDLHVKRYPYAIYVRTAGSRWRTPNGVTVGTDLRTLERANRIMEALGVRLVSSYVPVSA